MLLHAEIGRNDHREGAPHFIYFYPYISRPIIRYKLSTKDYQAILPPKSANIPSTGKSGLLTSFDPFLTFDL